MRQIDDTLMDITRQGTGGKMWRPIRRLRDFSNIDDVIAKLQSKVQPPNPTGIAVKILPGTPGQLLSITATESPSKQQDRTYSQVAVSFTRDAADTTYDYTRIWLKGYKGNTGYVLQAQSRESPVYFLLESTNENITVLGQPVGLDGTSASLENCLTTAVLLDGVTSAPPAPTVTQTAVPAPAAVQFTFSQLSAQSADVIDSYFIYRNTTNNSGTAIKIQTIKHNQNNGAQVVVTDVAILANQTYYYWVSAINTKGLESSLTAATDSVGIKGNFSVLVETINLFGNPSTTGSGNLPTDSAGSVVEQWQYNVSGAGGTPEYRNGREIRLPMGSGGGSFSQASEYKALARFRPGQIVTFSFNVRRANLTGGPDGNLYFAVGKNDTDGSSISTVSNSSTTVASLPSSTYNLYRVTTTLTAVGGQGFWSFTIRNTSTQDDLYFTEPMLNIGADAAPFTTNTFLSDVGQYAYEGQSFVDDAFTDSNATLITTHLPTTAGAKYSETLEGGGTGQSKIQSNACQIVWGSGVRTSVIKQRLTAQAVAYYVQGDCDAKSGSGNQQAGVTARMTDSNNFYLARILNNNTVDLFKRVAGVFTNLGTFAHSGPSATLKLQVTDGAKKVFVNGVEKISSADNALTGAGAPGMYISVDSGTPTNNPQIDNLTAVYVQNVSAPPAPPTPPSPPPPIVYDGGGTGAGGTGREPRGIILT